VSLEEHPTAGSHLPAKQGGREGAAAGSGWLGRDDAERPTRAGAEKMQASARWPKGEGEKAGRPGCTGKLFYIFFSFFHLFTSIYIFSKTKSIKIKQI
jgi:hypothetical protein